MSTAGATTFVGVPASSRCRELVNTGTHSLGLPNTSNREQMQVFLVLQTGSVFSIDVLNK
jgi:hypothetical protein